MKKKMYLSTYVFVAIACIVTFFSYTIQSQSAEGNYENSLQIDNWSWQNAEIRSVFTLLSKVSGVDIVVDPNVEGKVTMQVTHKSWDEVFLIVCKQMNVTSINEDGYVYVMNIADYQKQQIDNATNEQAFSKLKSLNREIIKLKNITASEMEASVKELLSERGKTTVIEHNNAIIVFDTEENINQIRTMVSRLDIEIEQVSISAKIVEVSSGTINNLGIQWGLFGEADGVDISASHLPGNNVIAGALEQVTYGIISPQNFSAALEYLFSENDGEIVAQPSITTLDNKEAKIFMGQQVPVNYLDVAGNTTVQMIDAGTELIVTPHLTGNGRIMLKLNPSKKSYELVNNLPVINEQSAQTNVVVNNGETVVIAGLTSNEEKNSEGGIPFLKDIPLIGNLFKRTQKRNDKRDLIIFVTPHIIEKSVDAVLENVTDKTIIPSTDSD